jgi:hypothetical protein
MRSETGGENVMEQQVTREVIDHDAQLVHRWRVTRLTRLGIPAGLAEAYADRLDWHQVAELVHRGCPPSLALRIVR